MSELTSGIVAGLIASAIVFLIQIGYKKILRPWIEELLYRDVKIEGKWTVTYTENEEVTEIVDLKRSGHSISGTVTVTGGPDRGHVYELNGSFKNLILTMSFYGRDSSRLDRGCYTLQTKNNAQHLKGFSTFYQDDENSITCMECTWIRGQTPAHRSTT